MDMVCDFNFVIQNKKAKKLIDGHVLGKASKSDLVEIQSKLEPYYKINKSQVLVIKTDKSIEGYIIISFKKGQIWIDYYYIAEELNKYVDLLAWLVVDSAFLNHGISVHIAASKDFDVFRTLGFKQTSEFNNMIEFTLLLKDVSSNTSHPLFNVHNKYQNMLIERNKTETNV
jgi:hypothetical protein